MNIKKLFRKNKYNLLVNSILITLLNGQIYAATIEVNSADSFFNALQNANAGDTVKLTQDIMSRDYGSTGVRTVDLKGITLDGGGHQLHLVSMPISLSGESTIKNINLSLENTTGISLDISSDINRDDTVPIYANGYNLTFDNVDTTVRDNGTVKPNIQPTIYLGGDENSNISATNTFKVINSVDGESKFKNIVAGSHNAVKTGKSIIELSDGVRITGGRTNNIETPNAIKAKNMGTNVENSPLEVEIKSSSKYINGFDQGSGTALKLEFKDSQMFSGIKTNKKVDELLLSGNSTLIVDKTLNVDKLTLQSTDSGSPQVDIKLPSGSNLNINTLVSDGKSTITNNTNKFPSWDDDEPDNSQDVTISNIEGEVKLAGSGKGDIKLPANFKEENGVYKDTSKENTVPNEESVDNNQATENEAGSQVEEENPPEDTNNTEITDSKDNENNSTTEDTSVSIDEKPPAVDNNGEGTTDGEVSTPETNGETTDTETTEEVTQPDGEGSGTDTTVEGAIPTEELENVDENKNPPSTTETEEPPKVDTPHDNPPATDTEIKEDNQDAANNGDVTEDNQEESTPSTDVSAPVEDNNIQEDAGDTEESKPVVDNEAKDDEKVELPPTEEKLPADEPAEDVDNTDNSVVEAGGKEETEESKNPVDSNTEVNKDNTNAEDTPAIPSLPQEEEQQDEPQGNDTVVDNPADNSVVEDEKNEDKPIEENPQDEVADNNEAQEDEPRLPVNGNNSSTSENEAEKLDKEVEAIKNLVAVLPKYESQLRNMKSLTASLSQLNLSYYNPSQKTTFTGATGSYGKIGSFALGLNHYLDSNVAIHSSIAFKGRGNDHLMGNAGIVWKINSTSTDKDFGKTLDRKVSLLKEKLDILEEKLEELKVIE